LVKCRLPDAVNRIAKNTSADESKFEIEIEFNFYDHENFT